MSASTPKYTDPLVAVGAPLGPLYDEKNQIIGPPDAAMWIRMGDEFVGLGIDAMKAWYSAFVPAERDELVGLTNEGCVQELVDAGMLASFKPPKVNPALLDLIPMPLATGDGSAKDRPGWYALMDVYTHEIAAMDFQQYILWTYFNGRTTFGEAVERAERHMALQHGSLLPRLLPLLDVLLRTRAIFLDRHVAAPSVQHDQKGVWHG